MVSRGATERAPAHAATSARTQPTHDGTARSAHRAPMTRIDPSLRAPSGTPRCAATPSSAASVRGDVARVSPSARSAAARARSASSVAPSAATAPPMTITTSPRGGCSEVVRGEPPTVPRRTSSNCFVSSRATTVAALPGAGARRARRACRATRPGASYSTAVCRGRTSSASDARRARALSRQKSEEGEAVESSPDATSAASSAEAPGLGRHGDAGVDRRAHEARPGIGEQRRAGVGDERQPLARLRAARRAAASVSRLVVLVVGEHRRVDLVAVEQVPRVPRVLGEHRRDRLQHLDRAVRKIPHVADGGADDVERSRAPAVTPASTVARSNSPADWNRWRRSQVSSRRSCSGPWPSWSTPSTGSR